MSEMKQYVILGLGIFGSTIAKTLSQYNHEVIAIDKDLACVDRVSDFVTQAIQADFTDIDQLRAIVDGEQPELLKKAAGEELEAKESLARWKEQKRREEEERRGERKKMFAKLLGKDEDDDKPTKNRPPEF